MHRIEKLRDLALTRGQTMHEILYRNAGVAFCWYEGPQPVGTHWEKALVVHKYYDTLEEAVDGEMERLGESPENKCTDENCPHHGRKHDD